VAEKQTSLFEDESFRRPEVGGLVVISQPGRPLSKAQRAFNRLVTKVEELRARLDREIHRLDKVLAYYGEYIHPRMQRQMALRKELIRALAPFLDGNRLKQKSERKTLRMVIAEQINEIAGKEGTLTDEDLQAVFKQVHGVDFGQVEQEEMAEMRSVMEEMFGEIGIGIDLSDLRPDMSDEELASKAAEMAERIQQNAEERKARSAPRTTGRPSASWRRRNARGRQSNSAIKVSRACTSNSRKCCTPIWSRMPGGNRRRVLSCRS